MNNPINNDLWIPWMRRALQLASIGEGTTSPNPLVGAVVLDSSGALAGEGFHLKAGDPHAEINALSQAKEKSEGGILLVNLEPCCHQGRTPPCTEAIIKAGISKVIVALKDPDPRVCGAGILRLKQAGIEVVDGVLEQQASYQNRHFLFRIKTGRPWGILKWAMSLDGRISLPNGASKWISKAPARSWVHSLRSKCDAVIVGGETVRKDNPLLTSRGLANPEPLRVVFSKKCRFSKDLNIWKTEVAKTCLAFGPESRTSAESIEFSEGPELLHLDKSDAYSLFKALAQKGCNRVLLECGSSLASLALQQECVQELAVIVAPKLLGGLPANTPLANFGFTSIQEAIELDQLAFEKLDKDLLIKIPLQESH